MWWTSVVFGIRSKNISQANFVKFNNIMYLLQVFEIANDENPSRGSLLTLNTEFLAVF